MTRQGAKTIWALVFACVLAVAGVSPSAAQFPPPPGGSNPFPPASGQSNPFPPPPGQSPQPGQASPFPPPQGQSNPFPPPRGQGASAPISRGPGASAGFPPPGGSNPCEAFVPIRQDVEKAGSAIQAAGQRKAPREEVCPLFTRFVAVEAKMVNFLVSHQTACQIPAQAITQAKANHARTVGIRKNVCAKGVAAPAPAGPTLSEAIGGPILPEDSTIKKGPGIFDTLTGSSLNR
jgi:hypothetical protein